MGFNTPMELSELPFFCELSRSKGVDDFKSRISSILGKMGFSDFTLGQLGDKEWVDEHVISTQKDFLKTYRDGRCYEHDFQLEHMKSNLPTPLFLSTVEDYVRDAPFFAENFSKNIELIKIARCYGYGDSYNIVQKETRDCGRIFLSITAKDVKKDVFKQQVERHKSELDQLLSATAQVVASKYKKHFLVPKKIDTIHIPPKPLALLSILAQENLTLKDAAKKLNVSVHTANKHASTIKKALGATTLASAVYFAMQHRLIT